MSENEDVQKSGVSRRTVTKAMAWAVPAIAVAAPIPAFAASGTPPTVKAGRAFKWPGASCENVGGPLGSDGNKAYLFTFQVQNTSNKPIYVYSVSLTTDSALTFAVYATNPAIGTPIAPNATVSFSVWANGSSSGNLSFNATATITWGHNYPGPDPANHTAITEKWRVSGTPTLTSQGYGQCTVPGYVPL